MPRSGPRAVVLSVGSELLRGETVDTNAAFLAGSLAELGVTVLEVHQLPDDRGVIAEAFQRARETADLVIATGGLGPTHDDLTREGLADALGEELRPDTALEATLHERFAAYGRMPESNLRQALLVPSAEPLANPIGSAPGWWVDSTTGTAALLPGVPAEMRRMWTDEVAPRVKRRLSPSAPAVRVLKTFAIGESAVAERLSGLLEAPGDGIESGIYARDDGVHLRFATSDGDERLEQPARRAAELLGDDLWGTDGDELAEIVLRRLGERGVMTLATWEAGTGGSLLAILAGVDPSTADGAARYAGGVLDAGGTAAAPVADAVLQVSLLPGDAHGRSRVRVAMSGAVPIASVEARIHGSGPQRLRRAAFAALDQVRRALSGL
jgi:nicotinamide-nucleotide amidase